MVEIIPKVSEKISKKFSLLFYLAIFLLLLSIVSYFALDSALKKSKDQLTALELDLAKKMFPQEVFLEEEVLAAKNKIENFSYLIEKHLNSSRVFEIVESNCHPRVWFSSFSFDPRQGEVRISGQTESFEFLGQQILILRQEEKVKKIDLSKVDLNQEGRVVFDLSLSLDPGIFSN